jgi:hypothetical protein
MSISRRNGLYPNSGAYKGSRSDAMERAVEFFKNVYRIPVSELLPYNTLLVPFGYFFHHHPDKPDATQKNSLDDFFWRCSLAARYSSSVESKLAQDAARIDLILKSESPGYEWGIDTSPSSSFKTDGSMQGEVSSKQFCACTLFVSRSRSMTDRVSTSATTGSNKPIAKITTTSFHAHIWKGEALRTPGRTMF